MNVSTRNGALAGILAGLAYLIESVMGVVRPQPEVFASTSDYILEAIFIVALLATVLALVGLHGFAAGRDARLGTVGFWLTAIGTSLLALSAIATLLAGQNSLGLAFLGGLLLNFVGYILLGIAALRAKVLPAWMALGLCVGFPLSVLLSSFGGGILLGLAWLVVGYFLLRQKSFAGQSAYSGKSV